MELIHRTQYIVDTIHLDCFGRVKPSVLLYFAQEAAGQHCLELGTDWDTLQKKGLFWALIRTRVQVLRLPGAGEKLTVETWPVPTSRTAYPRCTVGYDAQGEPVFRSMSLWVLMDTNTRSMVLPGKSGVTVEGILRGTEPDAPRSFPEITPEHTVEKTVGYAVLDRNGHMNNTRYMDWVDDLLSAAYHGDHPIKEFTVCYMAEVLEGQRISLGYALDPEGSFAVDAHREKTDVPGKTERVFSVRVQY